MSICLCFFFVKRLSGASKLILLEFSNKFASLLGFQNIRTPKLALLSRSGFLAHSVLVTLQRTLPLLRIQIEIVRTNMTQ